MTIRIFVVVLIVLCVGVNSLDIPVEGVSIKLFVEVDAVRTCN